MTRTGISTNAGSSLSVSSPWEQRKKKTVQFFSRKQTIGLIAYLWMSSFCVPNTDSEVFRSSHKFVFSNLHMFTSHLARITTHTIERLLWQGYTHLHTIERSGHNTIHKQPMSYVSLKKASLDTTISHPGRVLGLISCAGGDCKTGTANLRQERWPALSTYHS